MKRNSPNKPVEPGTKFNNWTVVKEVFGHNVRKFLCVNDLGVERAVSLTHLRSGASRGLLGHRELKAGYSHGMSKTRPWNTWMGMKARCFNKNEKHAYKYYGGRGITVCDDWMTFEGFWEDMGPTYDKHLTLERIDVNGNYCKENCKWATMKEQSGNKTNTIMYTHNGVMKPLLQWAEEIGINYHTLYNRLFTYKLKPEEAMQGNRIQANQFKRTIKTP